MCFLIFPDIIVTYAQSNAKIGNLWVCTLRTCTELIRKYNAFALKYCLIYDQFKGTRGNTIPANVLCRCFSFIPFVQSRSYQNLIFSAAIIVRKHLVRRKNSQVIFSFIYQRLNRMYVVNALKVFLTPKYWKYMKKFTSLPKNVSYGLAKYVIISKIYFFNIIIFLYI